MGPKKAPTTSAKAPAKTTGSKVPQSKKAPTKGGEEAPDKPPEEVNVTEKPNSHVVKFADVGKFLLDDAGGDIKASEWWPYCVDTKDLTQRFLMMRHVNVINGLDANAMTAERVRCALLGAIRYGKPFAFDMMGSDLYERLESIFDDIQSGLMKMVLDKTIMKDENFMTLVRDGDSEEYQQSFQYDIHKERFVFMVLNNVDGPTGFSDKMMTVNIVHD